MRDSRNANFGPSSDSPRTSHEDDESPLHCQFLDLQPKVITIDPDGDLHLVVGTNECVFPTYNTASGRRRIRLRQESGGRMVFDHEEHVKLPGYFYSRPRNVVSWQKLHADAELPELTTDEEVEDAIRKQLRYSHDHILAVTYVVCSKTVARASKFFKRLLYGGYAESKPVDGGQWTVHLPDDDPDIMEDILNIMHNAFFEVQWHDWRRYLDSLYSLMVLVEKYDLIHLLIPYVHICELGLRDAMWEMGFRGDDNLGSYSQALWVAWQLGDKDAFKRLIYYIAFRTHVSEDGRLMYRQTEHGEPTTRTIYPLFKYWMEPPGASEIVRRLRTHYMKILLDPFLLGLVRHRERPTEPDHSSSHHNTDRFYQYYTVDLERHRFRRFGYFHTSWIGLVDLCHCEALKDRIIQVLTSKGLWPSCDGSAWTGSPCELKKFLMEIDRKDCPYEAQRERPCSFRGEPDVELINMHLQDAPLPRYHRDELWYRTITLGPCQVKRNSSDSASLSYAAPDKVMLDIWGKGETY